MTVLMESQRRLCLIVSVIIICCDLTSAQNSRPNIVIVLADDLVSMCCQLFILCLSIKQMVEGGCLRERNGENSDLSLVSHHASFTRL